MGSEVSSNPNSPYNPTNPGMRHNGLQGTMARTIGAATAGATGASIDKYRKKDDARLAGIADRQRMQGELRSGFDRQQTRAREGGNLPVFNPGQQVFK